MAWFARWIFSYNNLKILHHQNWYSKWNTIIWIITLNYLNILTYLGLSGIISPGIGDLEKLETLDLSYNSFSSLIPIEILYCKALETLYLNANKLTWVIPGVTFLLPKLMNVDLEANSLHGSIPFQVLRY